MIFSPYRTHPLTLAGALLISSMTLVQPLPAQEQTSRPHRVWKVKESSTLLWIENGMLVSATGQELREFIPLSRIRALTYQTTSELPAAGMMKAWIEDSLDYASGAEEGAGFMIFPMAVGAAILAPFLPLKSTRHLVHIDWAKEFDIEERVFLLNKQDARSLLNELRKATGIKWSNANQIETSKPFALQPGSAKGQDSPRGLQHGRLVFVDRGYSVPSMEILPLPPAPPDCTSLSSDLDVGTEQGRRHFEEAFGKGESPQSLAPPEPSRFTLRLNTSHLRMKSILQKIKPCRWPALEPSNKMK